MMGRERREERGETRQRTASLVSRLSFLGLVLLVACDPGTTRPDVVPFPESQQIEVIEGRGPAITLLRNALLADSFPIARFDARDAWLEGPWMDRRTLKPVSAHRLGPDVVRLRAWADPARPGDSYLTVELAWRPVADPSLPPRMLERPLPATDSLSRRVKRVLSAVDSLIGFRQPDATGH